MKESGELWEISQFRMPAHANTAGAVKERNPATTTKKKSQKQHSEALIKNSFTTIRVPQWISPPFERTSSLPITVHTPCIT